MSTASHSHSLLYKYRTIELAKLVLSNRTIRASHPSSFNDLLDGQIDMAVPEFDDEMRSLLAQEYESLVFADANPTLIAGSVGKQIVDLWRIKKETAPLGLIRQEIATHARKLPAPPYEYRGAAGLAIRKSHRGPQVFCLSSNIRSMPMWYHYADQYRGVAIVFNCVSHPQSMFTQCRPIHYEHQVPCVCDKKDWAKVCTGQNGIIEGLVYKQFFTKSAQWGYEEELRVILGLGGPGSYRDVSFEPAEFEGVVFGCSTDPKSEAEITHLARGIRPNCHFWKAEIDRTQFGFQITRTTP